MTSDDPDVGRARAPRLSRRQCLRAVGVLTAGATLSAVSDPAGAASLETDATTVSTGDAWSSVPLSGDYADPVAFAHPPSYDGGHRATTRLRNVEGSSLEVAVEEWAYLDGWHTEERVGCLVSEAGRYALPDGSPLEVGHLRTNHEWATVSFERSFSTSPVVLAQAQTYHGDDPIVTRIRNASRSGIDVRVQEEEGLDGWHATERIGYLAIEPGSGTLDGRPYEAGVRTVDDGWATIEFGSDFAEPVFLADVQSFRGGDPCSVRRRNCTGSGVEVRVEEERSDDDEVWHADERVGYLVVEGDATSGGPAGYGTDSYGADGYGG